MKTTLMFRKLNNKEYARFDAVASDGRIATIDDVTLNGGKYNVEIVINDEGDHANMGYYFYDVEDTKKENLRAGFYFHGKEDFDGCIKLARQMFMMKKFSSTGIKNRNFLEM